MSPVHLGSLRWGEIPGDEDEVAGQPRQRRRVAPRRQVEQHAADDVIDVASPLAQVVVAELGEKRVKLVRDCSERPLRVDALLSDKRLATVDEQLVFEHQELRVEDVGARADLAQQPVSDGL